MGECEAQSSIATRVANTMADSETDSSSNTEENMPVSDYACTHYKRKCKLVVSTSVTLFILSSIKVTIRLNEWEKAR